MELVSTRDFKIKANKYLNQRKDIVITKYGKPFAILTPIKENSVEGIYIKLSEIIKASKIQKKDLIKALDEVRKEIYV